MIDILRTLVELADTEQTDTVTNDNDNLSLTNIIQESISIDHLEKIYFHITEMVRFGEAKNGALLTVNIVLFMETAKMGFKQNGIMLVCSLITWFSLLVALSILFISFLPKLKKIKTFNPIFFGSVVKTSKADFTSKMKDISTDELHHYYCEQIHINSIIANRKFVQFRYALCFTVITIIGFGISKILL